LTDLPAVAAASIVRPVPLGYRHAGSASRIGAMSAPSGHDLASDGKITREVRTFETTTSGLLLLLAWLTEMGCTHVAMEATGVYWNPVWNILSDGDFELVLANAAHIKNVRGRKTMSAPRCGLFDNNIITASVADFISSAG
jgi:hypothetical protein